MSSSLDEGELDRLFQLPLNEFVKARNELAAALKKSKDVEAAETVKAIGKPSASAWAVNQLYWRDRRAFEALVSAGDRYREAQQEALSGEQAVSFAAAERERSEAIERALRTIASLLRGEPLGSSPTLLRRITATLAAIASYGSAHPRPARGRLTEDLQSPGFGALSSLAPKVPPARPRLVPVPRPAAPARPEAPRAPEPPAPTPEKVEQEERAREQREEALAALELARSTFVAASARAEEARALVERARAKLVENEREEKRVRAGLERVRESMLEAERRLNELDAGESPGKR